MAWVSAALCEWEGPAWLFNVCLSLFCCPVSFFRPATMKLPIHKYCLSYTGGDGEERKKQNKNSSRLSFACTSFPPAFTPSRSVFIQKFLWDEVSITLQRGVISTTGISTSFPRNSEDTFSKGEKNAWSTSLYAVPDSLVKKTTATSKGSWALWSEQRADWMWRIGSKHGVLSISSLSSLWHSLYCVVN